MSRQAESSITLNTPDYQRVIDDIEHRIEIGDLQPGARLPTIAQMARDYETGQTTVKTALAILRAQGTVRGQQGKATYVADRPGSPL